MEQSSNYLFVYGTLLDDSNEFAAYMKHNCSFYSKGKFKGRLYDLGEYPGTVADEDYLNYVYGSIYKLNSPTALKHLDAYEGFGPDEEQPNLFIRKMLDVETNSGLMNCWVYLYNLSADDFRLIESGDYVEYKNL
jgi:gamma-glutamylcyclotransferase (GGCT)/AIG2-like uncharacterized protein YtfP